MRWSRHSTEHKIVGAILREGRIERSAHRASVVISGALALVAVAVLAMEVWGQ